MTIYNADEKPFSKWKPSAKYNYVLETLYPHIHENCRSEYHPQGEYAFDEVRKWRFDYSWPEVKIAVEIFGFGAGHQAMHHVTNDHTKINQAVIDGWRVLVFTSKHLGSYDGVTDAVTTTIDLIL